MLSKIGGRNMKKKLLAILAGFVAITPLAGVKAADIQYTIGTEHNFIVNPARVVLYGICGDCKKNEI